MNRSLRSAALAALAVLGAALPAAAQTIPSSFRFMEHSQSLSVYAGYLLTDPTLALPDSQSAELGPQSAPLVGVRYNLRFGGPVSGEVHVGFSPAKRTLYNGVANDDSSVVRVTSTGASVSEPVAIAEAALRFHLTGDRTYRGLAPFLLASGGVVAGLGGADEAESTILSTRHFDFGPSFAVGTGAGVDFFPSQQVSVRAELTYRLWRLRAPAGLLPADVRKLSEWSANTGVSVGAAYHF